VIAPWRALARTSPFSGSTWTNFLADFFRSIALDLRAVVRTWPSTRYEFAGAQE